MRPVVDPVVPPSLARVQAFLGRALQRREPLASDRALSAEAAEHVRPSARLSPAEHVDIYRRQFWLRHDDALRDDLPGLAYVLGDADWDRFVGDYLEAFPPRTPSLRELGADVARFLETWPALAGPRAALARDMARYELAFVDVFDGPEPPALDPGALRALGPDAWVATRLRPSALVARLRLGYPVHRLRLAVREGAKPALPEPSPVRLALFRHQLVVHFEELEPAAFALLDALARGLPLGAACTEAARGLDEAELAALAGQLGPWFEAWARWGFFSAIEPPEAGRP